MTGLVFLVLLAIWCLLVALFTCGILRLLARLWWRWPVAALAFPTLLVAPLMDEIIGGREFAALCEANSRIRIHQDSARDRPVYEASAQFTRVGDTRLPVMSRLSEFVDADTGDTLISYREYSTQGGWLSEWLRFSDSREPLTFVGGCNPGGRGRLAALLEERNMTLVRRPPREGRQEVRR